MPRPIPLPWGEGVMDLRLVIECPDGTRISLASETSDWGRVETLVRSLIAR